MGYWNMDSSFKDKTCIIVMANYDDWLSIAHIVPVLDGELFKLGLKGRVVIVDDSSDNVDGKEILPTLSLSAIQTIDEIQLGNNQGNQRALAIGVAYVAKNAKCDYLVVMDSDNEDKPEHVRDLLMACSEHNDKKIIFAERSKRSEGRAFRLSYWFYKWLFKRVAGISVSVGNFSVIPGHLIRRISHISTLWNHFPISIIRSGLPHRKYSLERGTRLFGKGKTSFVKLIVHAFSGIVIYTDVIAVRIMLLTILSGLIFIFIVALVVVIWLGTDVLIPGWTSQFLTQIFSLFVLVLCTVTIVLILILSLRMQPPMVPYHDHGRFIYEISRIFPPDDEGQT